LTDVGWPPGFLTTFVQDRLPCMPCSLPRWNETGSCLLIALCYPAPGFPGKLSSPANHPRSVATHDAPRCARIAQLERPICLL